MPKERADKSRLYKLSAIDIDRIVAELWEGWSRPSLEERAIEDRELNEAYPNGFGQHEVANALIVISGYDISLNNLQADKYLSLFYKRSLSCITGDQQKLLVMHATRLLRLKARCPAFYYHLMNVPGWTTYQS
jgi:hypothetical protein